MQYKSPIMDFIKYKNGEKGTPGEKGDDGRTSYLHIKYSDDGKTFTADNGEMLGAWIGTLVDFEEIDSTNFDDYTWKKFTEDVDEELEEIRQTIIEQNTSIISDCENIILEALTSYTETGDFNTFKETVNAQLKLLSDEMVLKFTEATQQIQSVDGDLQEKYNTITKHFTFNINGLTIGQADSPFKVNINNDRYSMTVNGVEVLWLDPDGKSNIPELTVEKSFNLLGYLLEEDSEGNVNCRYGGGE